MIVIRIPAFCSVDYANRLGKMITEVHMVGVSKQRLLISGRNLSMKELEYKRFTGIVMAYTIRFLKVTLEEFDDSTQAACAV
ncbi:hypothetical protein Plhal304r1_c046g0127851 [Plasmopara halstedii]